MSDTTLKKVKKLIKEKDTLISCFNMDIVNFQEGTASVSMNVKDNHVNAAGVCHGGVIFSLADVAFALACNSHGTLALALEMSISFLKAVQPGETITAVCCERHRGKSTGCYTIEVKDSQGKLIALLKATAFRKNTPFV
jgi:acyl-CoA thioesterase